METRNLCEAFLESCRFTSLTPTCMSIHIGKEIKVKNLQPEQGGADVKNSKENGANVCILTSLEVRECMFKDY